MFAVGLQIFLYSADIFAAIGHKHHLLVLLHSLRLQQLLQTFVAQLLLQPFAGGLQVMAHGLGMQRIAHRPYLLRNSTTGANGIQDDGTVISMPRRGGLHHRYGRRQAA
jgi:hypothetical protein